MVKKTSFLDKLKSRLRTNDVRVEVPDPTDAPGVGELEVVDTRRTAEKASKRKLSEREEATLALQEGFAEVASLLRGMLARGDAQSDRLGAAADGMAQLPALQEQQVTALQAIAERIDQQNLTTAAIAERLSGLPEMLTEVREALDRAAATDERTAQTLSEFRGNMDRIHAAMDQMVDHSASNVDSARRQAEATEAIAQEERGRIEEVTQALTVEQKRTAQWLEVAQRETAQELRDAQAEHATKLQEVVEHSASTHRGVMIMIGLLCVVVAASAAALIIL